MASFSVTTTLFTIISIVAIAYCFFIVCRNNLFSERRICYRSLFAAYFCLLNIFGVPVLAAGSSIYHLDYLGIKSVETLGLVLFFNIVILVILLETKLSGRVLTFLDKSLKAKSPKTNFSRKLSDSTIPIYLVTMLSISVVVLWIWFFSHEVIRELYISGSFSEIRKGLTSISLGMKAHYLQLFLRELPIFSCLVALSLVIQRKSVLRFTILIVTFFMAIFGCIVFLEKAPIVWFLISLAILLFPSIGVRQKTRFFLTVAPAVLIVFYLMYYYFMGMNLEGIYPTDILWSIIQRITLGGPSVSYHYLEMFPVYESFLNGASFPNPKGVFPYENVPLATVAMEYIVAGKFSSYSSSAPGAFWLEGYANFGVLGIFLFGLLVSLIVGFVSWVLALELDYAILNAFGAWLATHFLKLGETSLSNYFFDEKILFFGGLTIFCLSIEKYRRKA